MIDEERIVSLEKKTKQLELVAVLGIVGFMIYKKKGNAKR